MQVSIILEKYADRIEKLQQKFPQCSFVVGENHSENSEVIWGNIDPKKLIGHKNLRWMQTSSAGVDSYLDGCFPAHATLTNSTGAYSLAIAEYMVAVHLALYKKLPLYRDAQAQRSWQSLGVVRSMQSCTVLILGMGDIGSEYAKRVKALGAYVIGVRRTDARKPDYVDEVYLTESIPELLPRADVLALALPGTAKTSKLINSDSIALMKNDAVIINVGRGNAIDTDALYNALNDGKLGGAALDVTDPEPLPKDNKLWDLSNVLITPHVSGGFHMQETVDEIYNIFEANLTRYILGQELVNIVDFEQGYRKLKI